MRISDWSSDVCSSDLGLAWFSQHSQGFDETGGSAALRSRGQTDNITTTTLGLRGKTVLEMGRQDVRLTAGLGWRHASGDVNATRPMSFIQGNGEIGRAPCRERVCKYVRFQVVAGNSKNKK